MAPTSAESYEEARAGVQWLSAAVDSVNLPEDLDRWPQDLQALIRASYQRPRGYQDYEKYWKAYIYGDPERGAERVQHLKDAGVRNLVLGFSFGGLPYTKVRRSMELFATRVMPQFK